nr:sulfotransferase family 2 domain-containing protein [Bacteroidota bacterium]
MLISHRKRFIYTKTHKTAGTSIESYFEKYCMKESDWSYTVLRDITIGEEGIIGYRGMNAKDKYWRNHMPASEIRNKTGPSIWDKYFKFCVIRNPFDKLISGFYFTSDKVVTHDLIMGFRNWIKSGKTQLDRNKYMIGEKICMDYFIKYEELNAGVKEVCDKLNIPFEPERIPEINSGYRDKEIPVKAFYDDETITIISKAYKFEMEYFNYDIPR